MRKNRIRLTESQLHRVIKESVNKVLVQEGFKDSMKGAWQGMQRGANNIHDTESALHDTSYGVNSACEYFGQIMKALSKNDVNGAKQICQQAYQEIKGGFNRTNYTNQNQTVTGQYGANNNFAYQQ